MNRALLEYVERLQRFFDGVLFLQMVPGSVKEIARSRYQRLSCFGNPLHHAFLIGFKYRGQIERSPGS